MIQQKYAADKFLLQTPESDPVELWVFNHKTFQDVPIIEDQAQKCAEAIVSGAKEVFKMTGMGDQIPTLDLLEKAFTQKIQAFFTLPVTEEHFKDQIKKTNRYIRELLNDIGYIYGENCGDVIDDAAKFYKDFYKSLWHAAEEVDLSFKKNNILVINRAANTVQYYARGTQSLIPGDTEKQYISAHKRDEVGVPNFIAYSTGHLDANGNPVITEVGFRHASLPPIELYKKEEELPEGDLHAECVEITTQNIDLLAEEMRRHLGSRDEKLHWLNVSLLTATGGSVDDENQKRQYRETILGAERIRSRKNGIVNPITFDFGVNIFATNAVLWPCIPRNRILKISVLFPITHVIHGALAGYCAEYCGRIRRIKRDLRSL